jgi:hypothetical protein
MSTLKLLDVRTMWAQEVLLQTGLGRIDWAMPVLSMRATVGWLFIGTGAQA